MYLKHEGYEDRILLLQDTLPIAPAHYNIVPEPDEPAKSELKVALLRRLINLLRR